MHSMQCVSNRWGVKCLRGNSLGYEVVNDSIGNWKSLIYFDFYGFFGKFKKLLFGFKEVLKKMYRFLKLTNPCPLLGHPCKIADSITFLSKFLMKLTTWHVACHMS